MYENRNHVRTEIVKMRLRPEEKRTLDAIARFNKKQTATLAHEVMQEFIEKYIEENNL